MTYEDRQCESKSESSSRIRRLKQLLDCPPNTELNACLQEAAQMRSLVLAEIAHRIEGPINRHLATLPHQTYEQKSELCSWLNAVLASLTLGVFNRRVGKCGVLLTDPGSDKFTGAFQIRVDDPPHRPRTAMTRVDLPPLTFAERMLPSVRARRTRAAPER